MTPYPPKSSLPPVATASGEAASAPRAGSRSARRCLLFVPGARPDRFAKAVASGAETVCVDLEDSVPPDGKVEARGNALRFFASLPAERAVEHALRLNALSTAEGLADLEALIASGVVPDLVVLPKVGAAAELRAVTDRWGDKTPPLLALIESAAGVLHAETIAEQARGGVMFGAVDLAAELNVPLSSDVLGFARSAVVLAAKAAGVDAFDTPFLDVRDAAGLDAQARRARACGFAGMGAIHPGQIAAIQAAFAPTAAEIAEARRGLAAFAAAGGGACLLDGKLIERPVVERYRRILALASRSS